MNSFLSLAKENILKYLSILNDKLKEKGLQEEVGLFGGAVMCIEYNARPTTKDIDAVFAPKTTIYSLVREIAQEYDLPEDWFNDAVKGYISERNEMKLYLTYSNLNVYTPVPEYMFAMKCIASRTEAETDIKDIQFFIKYMCIKDVESALQIVEKYFPEKLILPKTKFLLEELFASRG